MCTCCSPSYKCRPLVVAFRYCQHRKAASNMTIRNSSYIRKLIYYTKPTFDADSQPFLEQAGPPSVHKHRLQSIIHLSPTCRAVPLLSTPQGCSNIINSLYWITETSTYIPRTRATPLGTALPTRAPVAPHLKSVARLSWRSLTVNTARVSILAGLAASTIDIMGSQPSCIEPTRFSLKCFGSHIFSVKYPPKNCKFLSRYKI